MTRMVFAVSGRGKTTGKTAEKVEVGSWVIGYWRPKVHFEVNVWNCFENRVKKLLTALRKTDESEEVSFAKRPSDVVESTKRCFLGLSDCRKGLAKLPANSCSMIITDPPHSDRVPYLELSSFWNAILGDDVCFEDEIVISNAKERRKGEDEYHSSMSNFFSEATRLLTPTGNLVLFFNARETEAWRSIQQFADGSNNDLAFAGKFPCNYSANSVVQDNRKGAMKYDWALVFSRRSSGRKRTSKHGLAEIPGWSDELPELLTPGA
jgi:adenine-specific DNA methylase